MQGILACCNPVPPLVKQNLGALHSIVLAARDKKLLTVDPALMSSPPQSEMADFTSNLLQSPLDLSHLEDSGDLDTVVKNKFTFANNNLVKSKPDLSVFHTSKAVTRASLVSFVSPFQRYTLLKPYLDSLETPQEEVEGVTNNENIRMDSIKKHFEKLTEMTPKRVVKKIAVEEDEEEAEVALSSDEEVEPKKPYFEDPQKPYVESKEKIPSMRQGAQKQRKGNNVEKKQKKKEENGDGNKKKHNLKRKGGEPNGVKEEKVGKTEPKEFNYNDVNYKHYGSSDHNNKDFDPNNTERDKKKFLGAKKKQQFNKRGGRSHTFKRP